MITLDTPIIIYPDTYNGQFLVRCEVEIRTQTATLYLAPTRNDNKSIFVGVKETIEGETEVRFPQLLRTMTLQQNLDNPDPVIADFFDAYVKALDKLEKIIVDNQHAPGGLATQPVQIGTTEWSLQSTWKATGNRTVGLEDISPAAPAPHRREDR